MSIAPQTFKIGIICATSFDNQDWFADRLGAHLELISHVYTNGANSLVTDFCRLNGLTTTIYPINRNSAPWSNSRIIEQSDKVYILGTPDSKNSQLAQQECERRGVKFERIDHEPIAFWKEKTGKIAEIMSAQDKDQIEYNEALKAIRRVL